MTETAERIEAYELDVKMRNLFNQRSRNEDNIRYTYWVIQLRHVLALWLKKLDTTWMNNHHFKCD